MLRSPTLPVLCLFAALGCETPIPDPPPQASRSEIPLAPPNALGSLAAGTDGAPRSAAEPQFGNPLAPSPELGPAPPSTGEPGEPSPSPSGESVPL
jgi:hypothetical protein